MKDILYKMHVTDHGYCKEMASENMSFVFNRVSLFILHFNGIHNAYAFP